MALTVAYNIRHLVNRPGTTLLTALGLALVIVVFVATLMLAAGLEETLRVTGSPYNAMVIRNGAQNEIQSGISRESAAILLADPGVAHDSDGRALATADLVVLLSMKKRSTGEPANVNVRGTSAAALGVREEVTIIEGRAAARGSREVVVGKAVRDGFLGAGIGSRLRLAGTDWDVVGVFDAGKTSFSSEIWGDADVMMPIFRRENFSSVTFKLADPEHFDDVRARLEGDPRLPVKVARESEFYASQSWQLALFIRIVGVFVTVVFSIAAVVGCTITMYAAVAQRSREIGILRALGFARGTVLFSFLTEAALLSLAGALAGIGLASLLTFVTVSTTNFATFAELTFGFRLTWKIAAYGVVFGLIMGITGALLPAVRAARLKVVDAVRGV